MLLYDLLNEQCQKSYLDNHKKGFHSDDEELIKHAPSISHAINLMKATRLALIIGELSEVLEGIRKNLVDEHCPEFTSEEIELADVLERLFDYCGRFNIRLGDAWMAKKAYNANRPFKHGKLF